jgi:hypothetical protein
LLTVGTVRIVFALAFWKAAGIVQTARARRLTSAIRIHLTIYTATNRSTFWNIAVPGAASIISARTIW